VISQSHVQNTASPANYQKIKKKHSSQCCIPLECFHSIYRNIPHTPTWGENTTYFYCD